VLLVAVLALTAGLAPVPAGVPAPGGNPFTALSRLVGRLFAPHAADAAAPDPAPPAGAPSEEELARSTGKPVEIVSARTASSTTYVNPDGTRRTDLASGTIRVKDGAGWHDVDTTLVEDTGGVRPRYAPVAMHLSRGGGKNAVTLTTGGRSLAVDSTTTLPAPTLHGSKATYADVQPGVDLTFDATTTGVEQSFVLRSRPDRAPVLRVPLRLAGLTLRQLASGELQFVDAKGAVVLRAPQPRMWDSSWDDHAGQPKHSAVLDVTVEQTPAGADLVVRPDAAFLADPAVVYPVVLDPTTSLPNAGDTWVESDYSTNQNASTELRAGTYDGGSSIARTLVKFDVSSMASKNVLDATLKLYEWHSWSCSARVVNVKRVTTSWSASTVTWASGIANSGTVFSSANVAYGYSTSCPDNWVNFGGLGSLVDQWAAGSLPNYGFMVMASSESDSYGWKKFYSTAHGTYVPALSVTYNTPPAAPTSATPVANTKSTDLTPTLSTKYADADYLDTGYNKYEVHRTSDGALITSGNGPSVSSGAYSTWTVPSGKLVDGTAYYWKVQSYDGVDVSAWSGNIAYTPDTSGPTGALTTPATGSALTGTVSLAASPTDGTNGSGVKQASFYVTSHGQKKLIGTDTSSTGGWTASLDTTTVDDGRAQLSVEYLDVLNNASSSTLEGAQAAVTVQNAAPAAERWTATEVVPLFHDPSVEAKVGLADGQLALSATDAAAPGRLSVGADREYLSGNGTRGILGVDWRADAEDSLAKATDGTMTRIDGMGHKHVFAPTYGAGLNTQFFGNVTLTGTPVATRVDSQLSFDWVTASPATGVPADTWSARWSGYVTVPAAGTWTFYGNTDDGHRIIVDGTYVDVDWAAHAATETSGSIALSAGRHEIAVEYYDSTSYASAVLSWAGPGVAKQVVPAANLSHVTSYARPLGVDETLTVQADGTIDVVDHEGMRASFDANGRRKYLADENGNVTATAFDTSGRPQYLCALDVATVSTCGSATASVTFTYDTAGRVATETGSGGRVWTFAYDTSGRLATVTDAIGHNVAYTYATTNKLFTVGVGGGTASVLFDANGRLVSANDARSATYATTFGYSGSTVTVRSPRANSATPLGAAATYTLGTNGQLLTSTDAIGRTTTREWDANLYQTRTTDPMARVRTATFDSRGNVLSATGTNGGATTSTYDGNNHVLTATDPLSHTETNTYDSNGNLLTTTDPLGRITSYTYDSHGQVLTTTKPLGNVAGATPGSYRTSYAYDTQGNKVSETDAYGKATTYTYDANGFDTSLTDPLLHTRTQTHDNAGRLVEQVDAEGGTTTYAYDSADRVVSVVPPEGNEVGAVPADFATTTTYDADGLKHSEKVGSAAATVYTYDLNGELVAETDPRGYTTNHVVDLAGQRLRSTDATGAVTDYTYDAAGKPATVATPTGVTTTVYDGEDLLLSSSGPRTDGNGVPLLTTYTYDASGRATTVTAAKGNVAGATPGSFTTTNTYDAADQLLTVADPAGGTTTYAYDTDGNKTSVTDPAGAVTSMTYDQMDREVTRQAPSTATATATGTVDAAGTATWTTSVTTTRDGPLSGALRWDGTADLTLELLDSGGTVEASSATSANPESLLSASRSAGAHTWRVTAVTGSASFTLDTSVPSLATTTTVYDDAGRVDTETDPAGTTTFGYDDEDRTTDVTSADGTRTYDYDANGDLVGATSPDGGFGATYDSADRVETFTTGGVTSSYAYDDNNNPTTVTTSSVTRTYDWDANSRLRSIAGMSTFAYSDQVNRTTVTAASGDTESRTFAADGLTSTVALATAPTATPWLQWSYTYDANGNVTKVEDTTPGTPATLATYGYDGSDRLTSEALDIAGTTRSSSWTYDTSGNRLTATVGGATTTYQYDQSGHLARRVAPDGTQTAYFHDARGNLASADGPSGHTAYGWNASGLLSTVTPPSGTAVSFGYDAAGARASRSVGAVTRNARYDADGHLVEETEGTTRIATYTYDDMGTPLTIDVPGVGVLTYRYDRGGSVIALTDSTHATVATYTYDAWGNVVATTGSAAARAVNRFTYRAAYGAQWDDATGLFMMGVRWYDPVLGRFLSRDAMADGNVAGAYVYAADNPVVVVDPSGLYPRCDDCAAPAPAPKPKKKTPPKACRCGTRKPLAPIPLLQSAIQANHTSLGSCIRRGDDVTCTGLNLKILTLPAGFKVPERNIKVNGGVYAQFKAVTSALAWNGLGKEFPNFQTYYPRPRKSAKTGKFLPGAPSLHSWGVAVDIGRTDLAKNSRVVQVFNAFNWEWGGDWHSNHDPVHFQFARTH
jgi:RHS repeat-associated protein